LDEAEVGGCNVMPKVPGRDDAMSPYLGALLSVMGTWRRKQHCLLLDSDPCPLKWVIEI